MNKRTLLLTVILVVILGALAWALSHKNSSPQVSTAPAASETPTNTALYTCGGGKTITAAYYEGASTPPATPDAPPAPGGSVSLTFADGSSMTLHQTLSADGGRYANADESFVFWDKGNSALVLQNGAEKDYTHCSTQTTP